MTRLISGTIAKRGQAHTTQRTAPPKHTHEGDWSGRVVLYNGGQTELEFLTLLSGFLLLKGELGTFFLIVYGTGVSSITENGLH